MLTENDDVPIVTEIPEEDDDVQQEGAESDVFLNVAESSWEVECTESFWKSLTSHKMDPRCRKKILQRIRLLASGEWRSSIMRRIRVKTRHKIPSVFSELDFPVFCYCLLFRSFCLEATPHKVSTVFNKRVLYSHSGVTIKVLQCDPFESIYVIHRVI